MDLKETRVKHGLSQQTVANFLDIHRDTLRAVESGRSSLKAEHIILLAELYSISTKEMMDIYMQNCRYNRLGGKK